MIVAQPNNYGCAAAVPFFVASNAELQRSTCLKFGSRNAYRYSILGLSCVPIHTILETRLP